ncbi:MAG: CARDB domain-containing protein [Anaerolineae bacterium]|nr:CARDB domain-containing protein [Anaerolineae bacterium]
MPLPSLYCSQNERLGFDVDESIVPYDVGQLHAGWYVHYPWITGEAPHTAGLDYAQIISVCDDAYRQCAYPYSPQGATLAGMVAANPGALWLVGNEPDCPYMDNTGPERYAVIYHDVYHELKRLDPTAQVAIGGVVQATPLRMRWLDRVWQEYQRRYGQPMPVDVWNVHAFVLREDRRGWGCGIPPGLPDNTGELRGINDLDRMDLFAEQIVRFRRWMADHGQRNKPLIVAEYGILFNEELGYGYQRVRDYMLATFDYFLNATDPAIGYPADGNRLVQRWAWFVLDRNTFEWGTFWGALFDRQTRQITALGQEFGRYAAPLVTPYVDLLPQQVTWAWAQPPVFGQRASLQVTTAVANGGNVAVQQPFLVRAWLGSPPGGEILGETTVTSVPGRYAGHAVASITGQVMINGPRETVLAVWVDPAGAVAECHEDNNQAQVPLAIDVDVAVDRLRFEPALVPVVQPGQMVTVTVIARLVNEGDVEVRDLALRFEGSEGLLEGKRIAALPAGGQVEIGTAWPGLGQGFHQVKVTVDPDDEVHESDEANNTRQATLLVPRSRYFFPWIANRR